MIKVSICCITYNHAPFIRQCLDGFLMQQCNFDYEILIHDDASSDGTQEIIKEYQKKYPEIIKPIIQVENQWSRGVRGMNLRYNFPRAQGKYIALCEGDDYWTDPLKLQKQVDFLEANPDYTFSMGRVDRYIQETGKIKRKKEHVNPELNETYLLKDYLKSPFSQTSSFLFKKSDFIFPEWLGSVHAGDQSLVVIVTGKGKIKYHKDLFSIYRVNKDSITFTKSSQSIYDKFDETLRRWDQYTQGEYKEILRIRILENILNWQYSIIDKPHKKLIARVFLKVFNVFQKYINK